jgi:regulator of sigma E protease
VIFAGPGVNLVFAVLLLWLVFALGVPDHVTSGVGTVGKGTAAETAGLQAGDQVVRVNGQPVNAETLSDAIQKGKGAPVTLTVRRDGELVTLRATRPTKEGGRWILGFTRDVAYKSYGPVDSLGQAVQETWNVTSLTGSALGHIVTGRDREQVSSPVGIVQGSSEALSYDYRIYLRILALISLSLALLNLLPLLPLDGGHIAFSLLEKARGRAIPRVAYERYSAVGLALVLMLFFLGLSNDVGNLGG